ncbi:MAG: winged helix-turn-helix transcriptional regulator [Spirochaetia bacterium]|nr:sugar phosphate nucleotidyltransferase [uncultured Treponema sp.]MCI7576992.1 winged helix-turn-helix transcriptional regulator [Spirochaetia bacterium]
MLSKKEFDVLSILEAEKTNLSQRELSKRTGYSVGTVNSIMADLSENGYVHDKMITLKGIEALEPYRVQRAVFVAAGFGSRLVPITLNTPKPLIRVQGERIIDTLLDAVVKAGIEEIIIVRGYLSEQFDQLLYKYPGIKFLENPAYNEGNNIASLICARYFLENSYILESDIILKNPNLITKYQYQSNYCGVPCDRTDDWCFTVDKDRITGVQVGGLNTYQMVGISYWTKNDGKKLSECLKKVYEAPGGKERYWDTVPLNYCKNDFDLVVRKCSFEDYIEIDTFNELKAVDSTYVS